MSSPAKARIASTVSHSDSVMNSVVPSLSRRSSQAPRFPAVRPYSVNPVSRMYWPYASASPVWTAPLQMRAIMCANPPVGGGGGSDDGAGAAAAVCGYDDGARRNSSQAEYGRTPPRLMSHAHPLRHDP